MKPKPPLLIITDRDIAPVGRVLCEIEPGTAMVQLRDKELPAHELLALTRSLLAITRPRRCPLLVNDRLDVALAAGADGVHLPEQGLDVAAARKVVGRSEFLIGASTHSVESVRAASAAGADFLVFGPIFPTTGKHAQGIEALREVSEVTDVPIYAIGGFLDEGQVKAARAFGAHGVAAIRAFRGSDGPSVAARFVRALMMIAIVLGATTASANNALLRQAEMRIDDAITRAPARVRLDFNYDDWGMPAREALLRVALHPKISPVVLERLVLNAHVAPYLRDVVFAARGADQTLGFDRTLYFLAGAKSDADAVGIAYELQVAAHFGPQVFEMDAQVDGHQVDLLLHDHSRVETKYLDADPAMARQMVAYGVQQLHARTLNGTRGLLVVNRHLGWHEEQIVIQHLGMEHVRVVKGFVRHVYKGSTMSRQRIRTRR